MPSTIVRELWCFDAGCHVKAGVLVTFLLNIYIALIVCWVLVTTSKLVRFLKDVDVYSAMVVYWMLDIY